MPNQTRNNTDSLVGSQVSPIPKQTAQFDNYSSHLFVFEKLFGAFDIRHVLEFGPGKYSTPFFVHRCESVVSVEQDSPEWYHTLKAQIRSHKWTILFDRPPDPKSIFEHYDKAGRPFDLVFSDGGHQTRCLIANLALQRNVPLVVLHDVEKIWYYKWNLLNIPPHYGRFDFQHRKGAFKVTTVLANNKYDWLETCEIPEHDRILHVYSSPSQPTYRIPHSALMSLLKAQNRSK